MQKNQKNIFQKIKIEDDLFNQTNLREVLKKYNKALATNPNCPEALMGRGFVLLQIGFLEYASQSFVSALSLDTENVFLRKIHETCEKLRRSRYEDVRKKRQVFGYPIKKFLGAGWEGAVYHAMNEANKDIVIKMFYPHIVEEINYEGLGGIQEKPVVSSRNILLLLSNRLKHRNDTLYGFDCIEKDGRILGIKYEYEKLITIRKGYLKNRNVLLGTLGAFLRTQSFLLRNFDHCMGDSKLSQYMLTCFGNFRYIDYGYTIFPINDYRCVERNVHVECFINMLYELFNPDKKSCFKDKNWKIVFDRNDGLVSALGQWSFLNDILAIIDRQDWLRFIDYRLYDMLAEELPTKVSNVTMVQLLTSIFVNKARSCLKTSNS